MRCEDRAWFRRAEDAFVRLSSQWDRLGGLGAMYEGERGACMSARCQPSVRVAVSEAAYRALVLSSAQGGIRVRGMRTRSMPTGVQVCRPRNLYSS